MLVLHLEDALIYFCKIKYKPFWLKEAVESNWMELWLEHFLYLTVLWYSFVHIPQPDIRKWFFIEKSK